MYGIEDDQADDAIYSTYLVHTDDERKGEYTLYGGQVFIDQRVVLALQGSLLQLM